MKRQSLCIQVGLALAILLSTGIAADTTVPRAYFGLASIGAAGGYHTWTHPDFGSQTTWWDASAAAIEARWVLDFGVGFGLRVADVTGVLSYDKYSDLSPYFTTHAEFAPSVMWVAHHDDHGFGYLELTLLPDLFAIPYSVVSGPGLALDYAYVPWAPVPIQTQVRLAATAGSLNPVSQVRYQASAGFRIGFGWWIMQKDRPFRI